MNLGVALREARRRKRWTQSELVSAMKLLSDTSHFDESIISRIETGQRRVSANELRCFAEVFQCSVVDLIGNI